MTLDPLAILSSAYLGPAKLQYELQYRLIKLDIYLFAYIPTGTSLLEDRIMCV